MNEETRTSFFDAVLKEPFRVFFPLGIVFGFAGVSHWLLYDIGWIPGYSKLLHGAVQIQCFLMAFAAGFLLTALPRFMGVERATRAEFFFALLCLIAGPVFLFSGMWLAGYASFLFLIAAIVLFALRRFPRRVNTPPREFVFVLFGLLHGFAGAEMQMLYWAGIAGPYWCQLGLLMIYQGMFLCLVMGIGGFLAPRLMGHEGLPIISTGMLKGLDRGLLRVFTHAAAALALFASFVLEASGYAAPGKILRAAVVSAELLWTTKCFRFPAVKDHYVVFLWVSLWMVIVGLWAQVLIPLHRIAALHILFIGGFSLMTLSIATRVTLSHCDYGGLLDKPLWAVLTFGFFFLAAMAMRFYADFIPMAYFHHLAAAAVLWMIGGIAWFVFFVPKMFRKSPR